MSGTLHMKPADLRGRRWRGLVRESTEEQAEKFSPERQRSDLRRAGDELGLVPVEPLFYERVGSGEARDVPEIQQALADGRRKQYDVLLVLHTSRLGRNSLEVKLVKEQFAKIGVVIYFTSQGILSGSRAQGLLEGINEVIDEQANMERRHWIAGGLRVKQLAGGWVGKVPYGYRKRMADRPDGSRTWDGNLDPDQATAPVVRRIYAEALAGFGTATIARGLNADGVRGPAGGAWEPTRLLKMLKSPTYKGLMVRYRTSQPRHYYPADDPQDGYREVPGTWQPIIDEPTWDAAQAALTSRRGNYGRPTSREYPLSTVLRCRRCGRPMTGAVNTRDHGQRYYRCKGRVIFKVCDAPYVRADAVEDAIGRWLSGYRLPPEWRADIAALAGKPERSDLQERKERLTGQMSRLRELFILGDVPEAEYRARMDELRVGLGETAPPDLGQIDVIVRLLTGKPDSKWALANPAEQRSLAEAILSRAVPNSDGTFEWVVRPELRHLFTVLEQHRVLASPYVKAAASEYTLSYSA